MRAPVGAQATQLIDLAAAEERLLSQRRSDLPLAPVTSTTPDDAAEWLALRKHAEGLARTRSTAGGALVGYVCPLVGDGRGQVVTAHVHPYAAHFTEDHLIATRA